MKHIQTLLLAALVGTCIGAAAHGDGHAGKNAAPVKKEQKVWGIAGDAKKVRRTIAITMGDNMRFAPDRIEVRRGETVKLVVTNHGKLLHELVLGTKKELEEHAALMEKFPGMEHDEPYMAHVGAGNTGELVWTFNRAGEFDFACLIPGHYQAGMVGKVIVRPERAATRLPAPLVTGTKGRSSR
ncbi:MAG TPA: cupredoxin family protein [Gemmatimonadales bacterium]|nr:cupredoxin family protein [Gemmatimonadales bacterium]